MNLGSVPGSPSYTRPWNFEQLRKIARTIGILVFLLGLAVLGLRAMNWAALFPAVNRTMSNTAACFILSGLALALLVSSSGPGIRLLSRLLALTVTAVGGLTLLEYLTGVDVGIDQLFLVDPTIPHYLYPGRMAHTTAVCFAALGLSLCLVTIESLRRSALVSQLLALVGLTLGSWGVMGYLVGAEKLYALSPYTPIALPTAIAFLLLSIGILLARSDRGFMRLMRGDTFGSLIARRLFPAAVVVPTLMLWAHLEIDRLRLIPVELSEGIFLTLTVIFLCTIIGITIRLANRIDLARRTAALVAASREERYRELAELERKKSEDEIRQKTEALERSNNDLARRQRIMVSLLDDIQASEQQLASRAQEVERSNRDLEQFAYVASHDLQEPLRVVETYTGLLSKNYKDRPLDDEANEYLEFSRTSAARMRQMIRDLLAYSRIGQDHPSLTAVNCDAALRTAIASLESLILERSGMITADPWPVVAGNEALLVQLFQNLISNAVKFHGQNPPRVRVSATRKNGDWQFDVRDNGIGFDPAQSNRIFMIFRRLHGRTEYPGSGIGLAICKRIVEWHGGRIWGTSTPDMGSTFSFTLPVERGI